MPDLPAFGATDYLTQFQRLLPRGRIWHRGWGRVQDADLLTLMPTWSRLHARLNALIGEIFGQTPLAIHIQADNPNLVGARLIDVALGFFFEFLLSRVGPPVLNVSVGVVLTAVVVKAMGQFVTNRTPAK